MARQCPRILIAELNAAAPRDEYLNVGRILVTTRRLRVRIGATLQAVLRLEGVGDKTVRMGAAIILGDVVAMAVRGRLLMGQLRRRPKKAHVLTLP